MIDKMIIRDSAGRTRSIRIPDNIQTEMAACVALDQLKAALASAGRTLAACTTACEEMHSNSDHAALHAQWLAATKLTNEAFVLVQGPAQALIAAVRKMLAV